MLFNHSLLLILAPLIACQADEGRLGASLSNYESVGTGRIFTSKPQPPIDRERLLREMEMTESIAMDQTQEFDSEVIPEDIVGDSVGAPKIFSEPITRRLRKISGERKPRKESFRNNSVPVVEPAPEDDRHLQNCAPNQKYFKVDLTTDNYGFENSWTLKKDGELVQKGPPSSSRYDDNTRYVGGFCLDEGNYVFSIKDQYKDGMCSGEGSYEVFIDGALRFSSPSCDDGENWAQRDHTFSISADNTGDGSSIYDDANLTRASRCQNVKIQLTIDKYGKETSLYLKNKSSGKTVMSSVKEVGAYQTKTLQDCVSPGTYTLLLQDMDGLCCKNGKGGYKVSVDGVDVVDGGYFIKSTSHTIKIGYDWTSSMSSRDKDWMSSHNSRRRTWHNNAGKEYRPVRWSSTLASAAEKWSKSLLSGCSSSGITHQGGVGDGENLAKNKGAGTWGSLYPTDKIVKRWVENEANLDYPHNAHLTQVIWYSTSYVGCGESLKSMGNSQSCRVQVCRYARPGNCSVKNGNWRAEAFKDDTGCGDPCPTEGCYV